MDSPKLPSGIHEASRRWVSAAAWPRIRTAPVNFQRRVSLCRRHPPYAFYESTHCRRADMAARSPFSACRHPPLEDMQQGRGNYQKSEFQNPRVTYRPSVDLLRAPLGSPPASFQRDVGAPTSDADTMTTPCIGRCRRADILWSTESISLVTILTIPPQIAIALALQVAADDVGAPTFENIWRFILTPLPANL